VRWLGWQRELRGFYSAVDILLFNSDWDAMGHTAVEAMSYGVPVVASVVHGGLKELIDGDAVGYITEEHDLDWLADKALHLLTDPAVRRAIGARARERMACVCSPERDAAKIIGLLDLDEVE
jgi:glycosyltransferase involved in cell wall biosynthesis